jgi:hypothetical protein
MYMLALTELRARALPYLILSCTVLLMSIFVTFELVVMALFLVEMRLNQLLNQREKMNGLLRFYFLLPIPRAHIVYGKIIAIAAEIAISLSAAVLGHLLSGLLSIEQYTEGYDQGLLHLIAAASAGTAMILIVNMQRYFLILGANQMVVRIRITVVIIVILAFILFYQNILPQVSFTKLVEVGSWLIYLFWILGPCYVLIRSAMTARQLAKLDIYYA